MTIDMGYRLPRTRATKTLLSLGLLDLSVIAAAVTIAITATMVFDTAGLITGIAVVLTATGLVLGTIGGVGIVEWAAVGASWFIRKPKWLIDVTDLDGAPPLLTGIEIGTIYDPTNTAGPGIIIDRANRTVTASVRVTGSQIMLLTTRDQHARVGGWSQALAQLCDEASGTGRIIAAHWKAPATTDDHLDWATTTARAVIDPDSPYGRLLASAAERTTTTDLVVSVAIDADRVRKARGETKWQAAARSATAVINGLCYSLQRSNHHVSVLDEDQLRGVIASRINPDTHPSRAATATNASAFPTAVDIKWGGVITNQTHHTSFIVTELPRSDIGPDWSTRLLNEIPGPRIVSSVFTPTSKSDAFRRVDADLTRLETEVEARERAGFRIGSRQRKFHEEVLAREAELTEGHAELGVAVLITLTSNQNDVDGLDLRETELRRAASQMGCVVRRLDGQHEAGLVVGMGLTRGIK